MSTITSQDRTAAENLAAVKAGRPSVDKIERDRKIPSDEAGGVKGGRYVVVAADDTAGFATIDTEFGSLAGFTLLIRTSANVLKMGNQVITYSGGIITVADGATQLVTTGDIIEWIAKGA